MKSTRTNSLYTSTHQPVDLVYLWAKYQNKIIHGSLSIIFSNRFTISRYIFEKKNVGRSKFMSEQIADLQSSNP